MDTENLTLQELTQGYTYQEEAGAYQCTVCGQTFYKSEVYPENGHYYKAKRAITLHLQQQHSDYTTSLLQNDTRYNTLTENQKTLLGHFAAGLPDKEVAKQMGTSLSTVRHQKFMFREKAKQAKLYLAMYQRVFAAKPADDNAIMPIHAHARQVDERYVITEQERQKILNSVFESLEPLKLKVFPPKEKKKVVILTQIAKQFEPEKTYTEKQVNAIIKDVFDDYVTLRRYLIEYGFLGRTNNGAEYWLL